MDESRRDQSLEFQLFRAKMDAATWKGIALTFASGLLCANVVVWVLALTR